MKRSVYDLTLDLQVGHSPLTVWVKRGDTHRTLRLHLADGGRPYQPTLGVTAAFTAKKPDGTVLYNQCALEGNVALYNLTPQTTALAGELHCELRLYGPEDALLTTAAFLLCVEDTVYGDGEQVIASSGEATALTKLMSDAADKLAQMDRVLENEQNHATIDDAKVGADAWSSKNIVDKLCPSFEESGAVAVCDPVEGYPLDVVSTINEKDDGTYASISLTRCGKNLFDFKQPVYWVTYTTSTGQGSRYGYSFILPAGTYTMHAEPIGEVKDQYIYCTLNDLNGNTMPVDGFSFLKQGKKYWTRTFTLPEPAKVYVYNGLSKTSAGGGENDSNLLFQTHNIQIEAGSVATDYAPYHGQTLTADFTNAPEMEGKGDYNWNTGLLHNGASSYLHNPVTGTFTMVDDEEATAILRNIPALPGTNYIYCDCGDTQVKGKADLRALLTKLLKEEEDG